MTRSSTEKSSSAAADMVVHSREELAAAFRSLEGDSRPLVRIRWERESGSTTYTLHPKQEQLMPRHYPAIAARTRKLSAKACK